MSVTIKDVAQRAKVSPSTVSRVLNNAHNVEPKTKRAVLKAIDELGYQPSEVARGLRIQKTQTIGLIIPDILNPFFAHVAKGVEDELGAAGYSLILCNSSENPLKEQQYLNLMLKKRVDGLIVVPLKENLELLQKVKDHGIPVMFIDREIEGFENDCIQVDNYKGARTLANHFAGLGHRRIGFIGGSLDLSLGRLRLEGYKMGLADASIELNEDYVKIGRFDKDTGYQYAKELLQMDERPTALISGNNEIALGVLAAIHELGLKMPDDIAFASFDDPEWAPYITSPLTVLQQPIGLIASMAVEHLLNPKPHLVRFLVEGKLVVRESCGAVLKSKA